MLILDVDVPLSQTESLVSFIQFLKPGKLFLKSYGFNKKWLAALRERLEALTPEIELIRQSRFRMTL
jgi:hypothetical protein